MVFVVDVVVAVVAHRDQVGKVGASAVRQCSMWWAKLRFASAPQPTHALSRTISAILCASDAHRRLRPSHKSWVLALNTAGNTSASQASFTNSSAGSGVPSHKRASTSSLRAAS